MSFVISVEQFYKEQVMKKKQIFLATVAMMSAVGCTENASVVCSDSSAVVMENIMTRTSVRKFDGREVEKENVATLLHAGMAAPTAMNKQPWDFVVITDRAVLDSLAADPSLKRAPVGNGCPLVILVCGNMEKAAEGPAQQFWIHDTSAATENILLAAHAMGLGAVWCAGFPMSDRVDALRRIAGLPSYVTPLNLICIGYPAETPSVKDKWTEANVHYDKW